MGNKHSSLLNLNKKEKYNINLNFSSLFPIVFNILLGDKISSPILNDISLHSLVLPTSLIYIEFIGQEEEVWDPLLKGWDPYKEGLGFQKERELGSQLKR